MEALPYVKELMEITELRIQKNESYFSSNPDKMTEKHKNQLNTLKSDYEKIVHIYKICEKISKDNEVIITFMQEFKDSQKKFPSGITERLMPSQIETLKNIFNGIAKLSHIYG
jgi:hypothetical protein